MVDLAEVLVLAIIGAVIVFYIWYASPVIRKKPVTGAESLVGAKGVVYSDRLNPDGEVGIDGVIWKASLANPSTGPLKRNDPIVVSRVDDLTLIVDRDPVLTETS